MPAGVVDRAGIADRYARHRAIAGFSQDALRSSRFAVVGAGAIGNEVVKNLCLLGVGGIDVYDLDTVELHNLTRSVLLREADLGAQKADCVARRAREIDPSVDVVPVTGDIHDTLGVATVRGYRAVVGALDNFEARLRLNQVCWLAGTDWVNAAIDSRHATVETFPFGRVTPGDEPPACYECGLPASVHQRIAARPLLRRPRSGRQPGSASCRPRRSPHRSPAPLRSVAHWRPARAPSAGCWTR